MKIVAHPRSSSPSPPKRRIKTDKFTCFLRTAPTLIIPEKICETLRRHLEGFLATSGERGEKAKAGVRRTPRTQSA